MCMFAIGQLILKYKRPRLRRPHVAPWPIGVIGLVAMGSGLIGNLVLNPPILELFIAYVMVPIVVMFVTANQVRIMKILLHWAAHTSVLRRLVPVLQKQARLMRQFTIVFFTKTDQIHILNQAILYTHMNERCDRIKLVHIYDNESNIPPKLKDNHYVLDRVWPKIQIDLLLIKGKFSPEMVAALSEDLRIHPSYMFICCPGPKFPFSVAELGGVRIIMS